MDETRQNTDMLSSSGKSGGPEKNQFPQNWVLLLSSLFSTWPFPLSWFHDVTMFGLDRTVVRFVFSV